MGALQLVTALLRQLLQSRAALVAENLALRHQIVILQRSVKRPRLHRRDRIFWVWLSRLWRGWRSSLIVVQPETVIRWHRQGFRLYWRWKSRSRCGRPKLDAEIRALIRRMSRENPTWGRRRIRSELHLLGYEVAELTVAKYMVRGRKPPSQGWRVFLKNHCPRDRRDRLLHSGNPELPHPHLLRGSQAPPTDRRSLQRHKSSDGALDSPADRGSVPVRHGAQVSAP